MSSWRDTEVSVVGSAPSTMTKPSTIGDILERIRNGKWQKQASAIAENYSAVFEAATADGLADPVTVAKEAVASAKKRLPGFLFLRPVSFPPQGGGARGAFRFSMRGPGQVRFARRAPRETGG